uniref:Uncharacterized protein n=1 Tax=Lactuca sativa TaxID=4236 RepID=A0A9R1VSC2_LACSA|nr:hypothetical protein LSAT_V11C400199320 [Lactuca sativa]
MEALAEGLLYNCPKFIIKIFCSYVMLIKFLYDLCKENSDRDCKVETIPILRLLKSFDFVSYLRLIEILGVINHLNTTLQRKDQDIINSMNQVSGSKKTIQEIKDVGWVHL